MDDNTSDQQKLWDMIKDIKFGMFTHRHTDGRLHSVPLTTRNRSLDEASTLYFFVSRKSELAQHIDQDMHVNVTYTNASDDRYVSVSGEALIVEDQPKKNDLFSTMAKAWFPGGATDPDLALLKVHMSHAEYWDVKESKMVQVAKMVTAAITGTRPAMGEHKEIRMS